MKKEAVVQWIPSYCRFAGNTSTSWSGMNNLPNQTDFNLLWICQKTDPTEIGEQQRHPIEGSIRNKKWHDLCGNRYFSTCPAAQINCRRFPTFQPVTGSTSTEHPDADNATDTSYNSARTWMPNTEELECQKSVIETNIPMMLLITFVK